MHPNLNLQLILHLHLQLQLHLQLRLRLHLHLHPPPAQVTATLGALVEAAGGVEEQPALHPWLTTVRCTTPTSQIHLANATRTTTCSRCETQALLDFLSAALAMQAWHFLPALMLLARCTIGLKESFRRTSRPID